MPDQVRVRFAPSPTGYLHVGGARTDAPPRANGSVHSGLRHGCSREAGNGVVEAGEEDGGPAAARATVRDRVCPAARSIS